MLNMLVILNNIIQFILYVRLLCKRYSTVDAKEVSRIIYKRLFFRTRTQILKLVGAVVIVE